MKRSEMIEDIASELIREESNFISWDKAKILAKYVLKRIEKEGMLPPFRNKTWETENEIHSVFESEWEPEND